MKLKNNVNELIENFSEIIKEPTAFLSVQNELESDVKQLLKKLYDFTKQTEDVSTKSNFTLPNLCTENFDSEQIWQQIQLQNQLIGKELGNRWTRYVSNNDIVLSDNEEDIQNTNGIDSQSDSDDDDDTDDSDQQDDINDDESLNEEIEDEEDTDIEIDKDGEDGEDAISDESIDYFQDVPSEDEDGNEKDEDNKLGPMYDDFFEHPKVIEEKENSNTEKKRVKFNLGDENFEEDFDEKENFDVKSSFEKRQERLSHRIEKLETEALTEKPWHMIGEITAKKRPQNSLLEQNLEFDLTVRPAPIITEEVALKLEDIIMQRIRDKVWDDVERKIKPVDAPNEFKKKLVLNQEKSKLSLAQIYEQEYLKKKEAANPEKKEEEEPKEHRLIKAAMDSLFKKLDALSNYHYTPRPAAPEVQIVNNLPAVTMEEAIPVTVSDAALVAPQEISDKKKGDLVGKEERTSTDKKRARRRKKQMQKQKYKDMEKKSKMISKLKPGMAKKEKLKKELEKLSKDKSISHFQEDPDSKRHSKSSKQFFEKLQDTVSNKDQAKKRKKDTNKMDAKKIKL